MSAAPSVSVIICAFTQLRWDDMSKAIDSALAQPAASEVIVIIDHEPVLLERVLAKWPTITAVENAYRQGLSGARNTALALATGEIVAFLDDDATASDHWLAGLLAPFDDDNVVAVGGKAIPRWATGKPSQTLPPELLWVVGCTYTGQPTELARVRNVMGCSMAFRLAPLLAIGGFNLDTGRVGSIPLGAEETEVCIRLSQEDPSRIIMFEPEATVLHTVTPERMTWRYLRRRSFFEGVSKSALSRNLGSSDSLSAERSYTTRILPGGAWRELIHGRPLGSYAIVLSVIAAGCGYVYGTARGARTPAAPVATVVS